jgi:transcriptional repressor NF-X1
MQTMLESIRTPLTKALIAQNIGKNIQLARLDSSLNILRKESDVGPGSGWSEVAASKGVPNRQIQKPTSFGSKGGFAVLSLSSQKKKQKEVPVEVAESWEEAEEEEEQKEKASGANSAVMSEDEGMSSKHVSEASSSTPASDENSAAPTDDAVLSIKPLPGRWSDLDDDDVD